MNKDILIQKDIIDKIIGNFIYIGLFLNESTKKRLIELIPKNLIENSNIYLSHCTLLHKSKISNDNALNVIADFNKNRNKTTYITITHIGKSDKALAFRVDLGNIPCTNENPHITICTYKGGKPVDSNFINDWKEIKPIRIKVIYDIV